MGLLLPLTTFEATPGFKMVIWFYFNAFSIGGARCERDLPVCETWPVRVGPFETQPLSHREAGELALDRPGVWYRYWGGADASQSQTRGNQTGKSLIKSIHDISYIYLLISTSQGLRLYRTLSVSDVHPGDCVYIICVYMWYIHLTIAND